MRQTDRRVRKSDKAVSKALLMEKDLKNVVFEGRDD